MNKSACPSIAARFLEIAERFPERSAVKYEANGVWHAISYQVLLTQVKAVAARLSAENIQPGDGVVLPSLRTPSLCAELLGVLWVGAHYVFIDPEYPSERQQFICSDAGARFGLVNSSNETIEALNIKWLNCETADSGKRAGGADPLPPITDTELPAYVVFTSGSTGKPKGVVVPQRGVTRLVVATNYINFDEHQAFLQLSALSFDASTLELWGPLLNGGCCVIHSENGNSTPGEIKRSIESNGVTSLWLTSSLYNSIISAHPEVLAGIKQLLVGGEALSVAHIRQGLKQLPNTRFFNGYGPTENTTFTTVYPIPQTLDEKIKRIPIGYAIAGTTCGIFDEMLKPVEEPGKTGELIAFGDGLALGYLNRDELTAEKFIELRCADGKTRRGYRTGDQVVDLGDGCYEYLQRNDKQVKIDGHRIEPGEIELYLNELDTVVEARVVVREGPNGQKRLAAYVVGKAAIDRTALREQLHAVFPRYMVPHFIIPMQVLPKNQNGKLDEAQLPDPFSVKVDSSTSSKRVAECWAAVLGRPVRDNDNFLDAGGTSLEAMQLEDKLAKTFATTLSPTFVFEYTTIRRQAEYFSKSCQSEEFGNLQTGAAGKIEFAIIGMACRLPGANNVDEFWQNLVEAREGVSFFQDAELSPEIDRAEVNSPLYVKAKGVIADCDKFDAAFFGVTPIEADLMDPQHRVMLELCWHALEDACIIPGDDKLRTGVFVGTNWARYYQQYVMPNKTLLEKFGAFNAALANESDFLSTRISYKLNLKGPSINVFTACSTGLVAVAQACAAIEQGQCEQALAGGVSIATPLNSGYRYQEGGMLSKDGHCRPFDAEASGTTFNDGAGVVVIKRRDLAERDGDRIYAVIKGYAVNNDGEHKASFTAPSVGGQVAVYRQALARANVAAESIGFVETHGTATPLGDPIEVAALRQAYAPGVFTKENCAIGSVKSNIGHVVHAAGLASLIKTVLATKHNCIPSTLFFQKPNPKLALENTPFYVNNTNAQWKTAEPRRAAVSSLGVGGTNAHVIIEAWAGPEAKSVSAEGAAPSSQHLAYPVLLSAKSAAALDLQIANFTRFISETSVSETITSETLQEKNLADIAFTAATARKAFPYRAALSASSLKELAEKLATGNTVIKGKAAAVPKTGFMFSGQGAQRLGMGKWLYDNNAEFRELFDAGSNIILQKEGFDLRKVLFASQGEQAEAEINQTRVAQPALFLLEYGLARVLQASGVQPEFFIGHSIGEFAAATLAGIFSFEDAISLVARRGALMQSMPQGSMLVVKTAEEKIQPFLNQFTGQLCLAAINSPSLLVVAGETSAVQSLQKQLEAKKIDASILKTSHAFHSHMMEPIVAEFEACVAACARGKAQIPIFSTHTGALASENDMSEPAYWARQLRNPVLFSKALTAATTYFQDEELACLEVGPGSTLMMLMKSHQDLDKHLALASTPGCAINTTTASDIADSLIALWVRGYPLNWQTYFQNSYYQQSKARKTSLPGYGFERQSHWLAPVQQSVNIAPQTNMFPQAMASPVLTQEIEMSPQEHQQHVQQQLIALLEDVSGYDFSDMECAAQFSEVGLDSLLLTQAATAIDRKFEIGITFRHLVEEYTTMADLSAYVASKVPVATKQVASSAPAMATMSAPVAVPAMQFAPVAASGNAIQDLVNTQLHIMQLQLQALAGGGVTSFIQPQVAASVAVPTQTVADTKPEEKTEDKPKARHTPGTRITREVLGIALSEAQKTWINGVLERYQKKFAGSKALTQKHRKHLADPRTVSGFNPEWKEIIFPIVTERSKGAYLWDIDGNELIDTSNGFGPIFFGHSPDFVTKAVKEQLDKGIETGPQSPIAGEVAELFCELTGNERCTFASTGSEAVIGALRLARTVTGRSKVVIFEGSYHGIFDEVLTRVGRDYQAMPGAPGISREATANMLVVPWGEQESLDAIRKLGKDLAAVLCESVQSRKPQFHSPEYIRELRKITEESGTALILDEVVTGFRVHPGGIRKRFDVDADMQTYGKVVGGGYPIGIIGGKAKFLDALDGGQWQFGDASIPEIGVTFFAGTFVRHPVALVAAKAIMEKIKAEGMALYNAMEEKTTRMAREAKEFIAKMQCQVTFEEFASLFYVAVPMNAHWGHLLFTMMTIEGIHIQQYRPNFLTTEHNEKEINKILSAFKSSLAQLIEHGLIEGDKVAAKKYLSSGGNGVLPAGARLGKNAQGEAAYFVEDPNNKGQYIEVGKP